MFKTQNTIEVYFDKVDLGTYRSAYDTYDFDQVDCMQHRYYDFLSDAGAHIVDHIKLWKPSLKWKVDHINDQPCVVIFDDDFDGMQDLIHSTVRGTNFNEMSDIRKSTRKPRSLYAIALNLLIDVVVTVLTVFSVLGILVRVLLHRIKALFS